MIYILLNAFPISLAMLAGLAIGWLWLKASGLSLPRLRTIIGIAVGLFWSGSILAGALILAPPEAGEWTMAIGSAVVIWCGFVLPAVAITLAITGSKARNIAAACGYWLVTMVGQAVVMQTIGLIPPQ